MVHEGDTQTDHADLDRDGLEQFVRSNGRVLWGRLAAVSAGILAGELLGGWADVITAVSTIPTRIYRGLGQFLGSVVSKIFDAPVEAIQAGGDNFVAFIQTFGVGGQVLAIVLIGGTFWLVFKAAGVGDE